MAKTLSGSRPNILIIITDQQRAFTHWPSDFVPSQLPSVARIAKNGMTFERAYIATAECTPSRAAFLSSSYPQQNGTSSTPAAIDLSTEIPTFLSLLSSSYQVVWKGKWHLFANEGPNDPGPPSTSALESYGAANWNPPDGGISLGVSPDLGGGGPQNDNRYVGLPQTPPPAGSTYGNTAGSAPDEQSAIEFLQAYAAGSKSRPFCLVVSLVNPHDVHTYSSGGLTAAGYDDVPDYGIEAPSNQNDDLTTKPAVQKWLSGQGGVFGNLTGTDAVDFTNFYAYLHVVTEPQIEAVLDTLHAEHLDDDTLIVRMADHGEMGLSHGFREKRLNCYEETIHVPLVFSHPGWFSSLATDGGGPVTTNSIVSLTDLMPTLCDIAGVALPSSRTIKLSAPVAVDGALLHSVDYRVTGRSLVPILEDPTATVNTYSMPSGTEFEGVLFTYDEPVPSGGHPGFIRCLRTTYWKYGVHFDGNGNFQYEMYKLNTDADDPDPEYPVDPGELTNLAYDVDPFDAWTTLHHQLTHVMKQLGTAPPQITWPTSPSRWSNPQPPSTEG